MEIAERNTLIARELRAQYMPWRSYKFMDDEELKAAWAYLQSLPEKAYGNR